MQNLFQGADQQLNLVPSDATTAFSSVTAVSNANPIHLRLFKPAQER